MARFTYANTSGMFLPDLATTHQQLDVYGMEGAITDIGIALNGVHHTAPTDLDMLLVAPDGQHNLEFWSDVGGTFDLDGDDFMITDSASLGMGVALTGGTYKPSDGDAPESAGAFGAPVGTIHHAAPNGAFTFATAFGGLYGNGDWTLYIADDAVSDTGAIGGWGLTIETDTYGGLLNGGAGNDTIVVTSNGLKFGLSTGMFSMNGRNGAVYEDVGTFHLNGWGGNDLVYAGTTPDVINGGAGRDMLYGNGGDDDFLIFAGDDEAGEVYDGGAGHDVLQIGLADGVFDLRHDTLTSIEGIATMGSTVQLDAGQVGHGFAAAAWVSGLDNSNAADVLSFSMGEATALDLTALHFDQFDDPLDKVQIRGDADSEAIFGSVAADEITGGRGNDFVVGGAGRDTIDGGKGKDRVDYSASKVAVNVALDGSHKVSVKIGGVVEDTISKIENVSGGSAGDVLTGDTAANELLGYGGADALSGGKGADTLSGGSGNDIVKGGKGDDQFRFNSLDGVDHIKGFSHADDTIALDDAVFSAFAKTGAIKHKMFHANTDGHEAHKAKQYLIYDKSDGSLWYDADGKGDGAAVEIAVLNNHPHNLDFHDFLIV